MILLNLICKKYLIDERLNNYETIKTARDIPQFSSQIFPSDRFYTKRELNQSKKKKEFKVNEFINVKFRC